METLKLGIKAVGVGKSGSKPIEDELAVELIKVIQASAAPPADWASELDNIRQRLSSFLGTLFVRPSLSHAAATRARAHARAHTDAWARARTHIDGRSKWNTPVATWKCSRLWLRRQGT